MDEHEQAPGSRDTRLQERAIRERWPLSESVRIKVLKRLASIVDPDHIHDIGPPGHREAISAARALALADRLNLEHARFEHATRPPERPADDFEIDLSAPDDPPQSPDRPPA